MSKVDYHFSESQIKQHLSKNIHESQFQDPAEKHFNFQGSEKNPSNLQQQ